MGTRIAPAAIVIVVAHVIGSLFHGDALTAADPLPRAVVRRAVHDLLSPQVRLEFVDAVHVIGGKPSSAVKQGKIGLFHQHPLRPPAVPHLMAEFLLDGTVGEPQKRARAAVNVQDSTIASSSNPVAILLTDPGQRVIIVLQVGVGNGGMRPQADVM